MLVSMVVGHQSDYYSSSKSITAKIRSLIITPVCTELMKDRIEVTLNMLTKYRTALR